MQRRRTGCFTKRDPPSPARCSTLASGRTTTQSRDSGAQLYQGIGTNIFMFLTVYFVSIHQRIECCFCSWCHCQPGIGFYSNFCGSPRADWLCASYDHHGHHSAGDWLQLAITRRNLIYKLRLLMSQRCDRSISSPGPEIITADAERKIVSIWYLDWTALWEFGWHYTTPAAGRCCCCLHSVHPVISEYKYYI